MITKEQTLDMVRELERHFSDFLDDDGGRSAEENWEHLIRCVHLAYGDRDTLEEPEEKC